MCGIAGVAAPQVSRFEPLVQKMVKSIYHRGPDEQGTHFFPNCALGSTRLSIIDIAGGQQPLISPVSGAGIAFNGEIYGYKDIRTRLKDYPFRTYTDTEVALALYDRYGEGFLEHLPGMFGLAIWDENLGQLLLARDRFGEKPLYYAKGKNGEFVFASEIKAILASGLVEPVLDLGAVSHFLKHMFVHPHQSIYKNIHSLPPAHYLVYCDGTTRIRRYWDLPEENRDISLPEAVEEFRRLFERAVRQQLVADVPVGAYLSGGLDSSTVVALASREQEQLNTFAFGFVQGVDSELAYAHQIAGRYGTRHQPMSDLGADIVELLFRMQEVYDEPFADSSNIPTYLLCKHASSFLKVVLTGDGADELLGGYLFWARYLFPDYWEKNEQQQVKQEHEGRFWLQKLLGLQRKARRMTRESSRADLARKYYRFRYFFSEEEQQRLGLYLDTEHLVDYSRYQSGSLNDLMFFDVDSYLSGDILVKTDRASMANSLELRSPFLDADLAGFCLSLPDRFKVNQTQEKILLREAYQHLWTEDIRSRQKQGFGGPMEQWLKSPEVEALKRSYLSEPGRKLFDILSFDGVQSFVERNNQQTWSLLVLSLWMEQHQFQYP